ncbi:MAG: S8 family serine peptidase [Hyphomicrobiales bacterium]|nr:S8 family serine peptidase [Hyphomicrobiales bacterium]
MVRDPGSRKLKRAGAPHAFLCIVVLAFLLAPASVLPAHGAIAAPDPVSRALQSDMTAAFLNLADILPSGSRIDAAQGAPVRLAQRVGGRGGGSTIGGTGGGGGGGSSIGGAAGLIGLGLSLTPPQTKPPKTSSPPPRTSKPPAKKKKKKKVATRRWVPARDEERSDPTLPRFLAREVLALVGDNEPQSTEQDLASQFGLTRLEALDVALIGARVLRYRYSDDRPVGEVIASLSGDPRVILAQRNGIYRPRGPKKKRRSSSMNQYALKKLGIAPAHKVAKGRDVLVAVIDTAIDKSHPALKAAIVQSFDATQRKGKASPHTHGTALAGVIAGQGVFKGVAPMARILAVRAFYIDRKTGKPVTSSFILLRAMDWAYARDAKVFNLSFAGPSDPLIERALELAHRNGVVHVAAAGNGGPKAPPAFPAAYESVIAITALDQKDRVYKHANRGDYLTVAAPGVDIFVPSLRKGYRYSSGTSIAAAHVSGLAALLLEKNPEASASAIAQAIVSTAHDLGPEGHDVQFGAGRADAGAALSALPAN